MPVKIFGTVLSHGVKGRALTQEAFRTLAESRDTDELVTRMKNTVYLDALTKMTKPYSAEKIEGALREYLVNSHYKMVSVTGGSGVLRAYFVRYITWNLKLVLKGKALGRVSEEVVPGINLRAEELLGRRDIIVKAMVAKTLDEAAAALAGSEFGEDASKAVATYKDKGDLRVFDVFIDHVFYRGLGRALALESQSPGVKNIVAIDLDSYNILAVLRGKYWNLAANEIEGLIVSTTSTMPRESLQKMVNAENIHEAMSELSATIYKEIVPQGGSGVDDISSIVALESGFETLQLRRIGSAFRATFSVGTMVAALKLMTLEVRNLSAIASGVEQKVPVEKILANIIRMPSS